MSTSASLANLLTIQDSINRYTLDQVYYSEKHKTAQKSISELQKRQTNWEKKYDKVMDAEKNIKVDSGNAQGEYTAGCDADARRYANKFVDWDQDDEDRLEELTDLDIEYDTQKTMIETMLQQLNAEKDTVKQWTETNAQDTHLLGT